MQPERRSVVAAGLRHVTDSKKPTLRPVFLRAQQPLFDGL
jgi:hypothetical protein